jgi:hypothetical protein
MPKPAESPLLCAFWYFSSVSPDLVSGAGKQKTAPTDHSKHLILLRQFGAGEVIRTLDPNPAKLYAERLGMIGERNDVGARNGRTPLVRDIVAFDRT